MVIITIASIIIILIIFMAYNIMINNKAVQLDMKNYDIIGNAENESGTANYENNIISIDEYPYKKNYIPSSVIHERINNLMNYEPIITTDDYSMKNMVLFDIEKYLLIEERRYNILSEPHHYEHMNDIGDYFTEECRLQAKLFSGDKFINWWNRNKRKYAGLTYDEFDKKIYETQSYKAKQVTNFRPSVLKHIIDYFSAGSMIDISSGWGDRLAAALTCNLEYYIGADPNDCLHEHYREMAKFIKDYTGHETKVYIANEPFETANLPDVMVDLCMTSPPYFALEIYSDDKKQSHHYGSMLNWYNKFLMPSIKKAWSHIKIGGHLAMNINDYGNNRYTQKMKWDINLFPDSLYLGQMTYSKKGYPNPQPVMIWQKTMSDITAESHGPKIISYDKHEIIDKSIKHKTRTTLMFCPHYNIESIPHDERQHIFQHAMYGTRVICKGDYNPVYNIIDIKHKNKTFHLLQDGVLPGGTKQRGIFEYLIKYVHKYNEFIYAGPSEGFAQIALSFAAFRLGVKSTNIVDNRSYSKQMRIAKSFGSNHIIVNGGLKQVKNEAIAYNKTRPNSMLLPFGLMDNDFLNIMEKNISEAITPHNINPNRLWLVAGSGTLMKIFANIFPECELLVVQVGKTIWDDMLPIGAKKYIAPEKFQHRPKKMPPYKTVPNYDGKLWQFVLQDGMDGDYILNVGAV